MIPAYNEEKSISKVISSIPKKIEGISKIETIVVDDGSKDNTVLVAEKAGARVFTNGKNKGLGRNFRRGIEKALSLKADIIVNIDGDGQFDADDIHKLVRPILAGKADMVTGSRFLDKKTAKKVPFVKRWGNRRFTNLVNRITKKKFSDTQCGFRAYSKEAALRLNLFGNFTYTQEVFIDLVSKGLVIKEVPIKVKYFDSRSSHISSNLSKYGFKSLGIIAKATRDTQPLTFFGLPGLIVFSLGFLGGVYSFIYWLINLLTTPIRTLFSLSVFFMIFGLSLIILALIADMMKRINLTQEEILYKLKKKEFE